MPSSRWTRTCWCTPCDGSRWSSTLDSMPVPFTMCMLGCGALTEPGTATYCASCERQLARIPSAHRQQAQLLPEVLPPACCFVCSIRRCLTGRAPGALADRAVAAALSVPPRRSRLPPVARPLALRAALLAPPPSASLVEELSPDVSPPSVPESDFPRLLGHLAPPAVIGRPAGAGAANPLAQPACVAPCLLLRLQQQALHCRRRHVVGNLWRPDTTALLVPARPAAAATAASPAYDSSASRAAWKLQLTNRSRGSLG
jgi:hypothetical protein